MLYNGVGMLDKSKLFKELSIVQNELFSDNHEEYARARTAWQKICEDAAFLYKVRAASVPWSLPLWNGFIGEVFPIETQTEPYCVASIDGSQIFPDRHQGTLCSLINVGSVALSYGFARKGATLRNEPFIYTTTDSARGITGEDFITCKRQEHELQATVELASRLKEEVADTIPKLIVNDGSLIFWHLEAQDHVKRDLFLPRYLEHLQTLYTMRMPSVGYISLPHSRELVGLIRLIEEDADGDVFSHTLDSLIASFFLSPYERTTVFESRASICASYPEHLRPHAVYIHVRDEIARLELPAWVAHDEQLLKMVCMIVVDQVKKGYGYPVALAEAHEQAVVKGPDRDFFYHVIAKLGIEQRRRITLSLKSTKKRSVAV